MAPSNPWPTAQPALPGMPVARQMALGEAQPAAPSASRAQQLQRIIAILRRDGPLTARKISARLAADGAPLDKATVQGILQREGAGRVAYDAGTERYSARA